jgi:mono/diheme cytochrome c family protein
MVVAVLAAAGACGRAGASGDEAGGTGAVSAAPAHTDSGPPVRNLPPGMSADVGVEGRRIYSESCIVCHGEDGRGTQLGPSLAGGEWKKVPGGDFAGIEALVRQGVARPTDFPVPMPAYGGFLTDAQVRAVSAYAWSLGH